MKLTFHTNHPVVGTGYGTQGKMLIPRLQKAGWQVAVAANFGATGMVMEHPGFEGGGAFPVLPQGYDAYSNDIIYPHHRSWTEGGREPGAILALYDAWPLRVEEFTRDGTQCAIWAPVDHTPLPPACKPFLAHPDVLPIAMSRFGHAEMTAAGVDARYAPHAIDRTIHRPDAMLRGHAAREVLGVPKDAFLVTINAANKGQYPSSGRKAWGENLQALAAFMKRHADVYVYLHTFASGANGVDLRVLQAAVDLPVERVRWADQYAYVCGLINDTDIAALHAASDVLQLASSGEGFGLASCEGLAVGTPSIVSDFSAQPEIVGETAWLVDGQRCWDGSQGAWFFTPFVDSILAGLEAAYAEKGMQAAADRRAACLARSAEYDADRVFDAHWRPILDELAVRVARKRIAPAPKGPVNTAIRPSKKKRKAA